MLEKEFQSKLIAQLKTELDSPIVLKNDASYIQGIPDLLVLEKDKWAMLECKKDKHASHRPNQDYYIKKTDDMSFGRFIYPENKDEVVSELKKHFNKEEYTMRDTVRFNAPFTWKTHWHIKGKHAFLAPSNYAWQNYDSDKAVKTYRNQMQKDLGTKIHEFASYLIKQKRKVPDLNSTFFSFVNDCIDESMESEVGLYYSDWAFGTADAIKFDDGVLKIFDLKTGKTKASMKQLIAYAALFCLDYGYDPLSIQYEFRIYQSDSVIKEDGDAEEVKKVYLKYIELTEALNNL